jgi:hypothetical protein
MIVDDGLAPDVAEAYRVVGANLVFAGGPRKASVVA